MTRTTNARIAGFTFLFYIAVAFPSMVLLERATSGEGIAAKLASVAQHAADMRVAVVLSLLGCFSALVLAVTLYAITREVDADLAMLALTCRVAEGVISGVSIPETLGLLWLATATGANAPDPGAAHALGAYLLRSDVPRYCLWWGFRCRSQVSFEAPSPNSCTYRCLHSRFLSGCGSSSKASTRPAQRRNEDRRAHAFLIQSPDKEKRV